MNDTDGARIIYEGLILTDLADVTYGISRNFEGGADDCPAHTLAVDGSIEICITETGFESIEKVISTLRRHFESHPTGTFRVENDSGVEIAQFKDVKISGDSLPNEWREHQTKLTVSFTGNYALSSESGQSAIRVVTISADGLPPIHFKTLETWNEDYANNFLHEKTSEVKQMIHSINADGVDRIETGETAEEKFSALVLRRQQIQEMAKRGGVTISFGSEETVDYEMKLESFSAEIECGKINWSFSANRNCFPEDALASSQIECSFEKNHEACEGFFSVSGNICAADEASAKVKLEAIKAGLGNGRALLSERISEPKTLKPNGDLVWIEMNFDLRFRDYQCEIVNFELTEDKSKDCESGIDTISCSGTITASTVEAARVKLNEIISGSVKTGWLLRCRESLSYESKGLNSRKRLANFGFSFEYRNRNQCVFITLSCETQEDCFSGNSYSVRGRVVAQSETVARQKANAFKAVGYLQLSGTWNKSAESNGLEARELAYDFTFNYATPLTKTSAQYTKEVSLDFEGLDQITTYSGSIKAPNEQSCDAQIQSIVVAPPGDARLVNYSRTEQFRECDGVKLYDGCNFSITYKADCSPLADIIDATVTVDITGSVENAVITPRPYDDPHVQPNTGMSPGSAVVTTNLTGRSKAAMQSFSRARRSLAPSGGLKGPPQERTSVKYRQYNTSKVHLITFSATYPYKYAVLNL